MQLSWHAEEIDALRAFCLLWPVAWEKAPKFIASHLGVAHIIRTARYCCGSAIIDCNEKYRRVVCCRQYKNKALEMRLMSINKRQARK
jgi:hypothetical protein